MQRIIEETNAISWFEIPVNDMTRARNFYETILEMKMKNEYMEETKEEVAFFPFTPDIIRATSGRVSGALVKNDRARPSDHGTLVYLNANPSLSTVLDKIEKTGGKILVPKTKIMAGFIAVIIDTEGNKIGLHANSD